MAEIPGNRSGDYAYHWRRFIGNPYSARRKMRNVFLLTVSLILLLWMNHLNQVSEWEFSLSWHLFIWGVVLVGRAIVLLPEIWIFKKFKDSDISFFGLLEWIMFVPQLISMIGSYINLMLWGVSILAVGVSPSLQMNIYLGLLLSALLAFSEPYTEIE